MPNNLLPIKIDAKKNQKSWSNYSLILVNDDVNVSKVNNWVKLDMGNSLIALNNIKEDLITFDQFDCFDLIDINTIDILNQIECALQTNEEIDKNELAKLNINEQ